MSFLYPSINYSYIDKGVLNIFRFLKKMELDVSPLLFCLNFCLLSAADGPVSTVSNCVFVNIALHSAVIGS